MEIRDIKQQLPIGQVLSYYGLTPDRNGMLNCPFHTDRTPSLQVYGKTNSFCCFSSNCSAGSGDIIDFIQLKEGAGKREAILKATELAGGGANQAPEAISLPRQAILLKYWQACQLSLTRSKRAQAYAETRHLDIDQLEVGFAGSQLADRWNATLKQSAEQYGLLHNPETGSGRRPGKKLVPKLQDCLVFPLKDRAGQVVSFYGRNIQAGATGRHYYTKDRQGLYPAYPPPDTKRLILTESVIDAASLIQQESIQKEYSILALYGTNGLGQEHIKALQELAQLEEIILFLDGDEAGRVATAKHSDTLNQLLHPDRRPGQAKVRISQVQSPEGEDINSLLEAHSPEVLESLLSERQPLLSSQEAGPVQEPEPETCGTPVWRDPAASLQADQYGFRYTTEVASYRISGKPPQALDSLKVSLAIEALDNHRKYRSKPDLYEDKQLQRTAREASEKLNLPVHELQQDLEELTDLLESYRQEQLDKPGQHIAEENVSSAIVQKAVELLKSLTS